MLHRQPGDADPVDDGRCRRDPRQRGHRLGDAGRHGHPAGQPGHQPHRTGWGAAGGTITFKLYGPSNNRTAAPWPTPRPTVAVTGNGTYNTPAPTVRPDRLPGDYHWVAVYSGNSPNTNGVDPQRCLHRHERGRHRHQRGVVDDDGPDGGSRTTRRPISAPAGSGNLAGTVSFKLYAIERLRVGGDAPSTAPRRPVVRRIPADGVDVEHDRSRLATGSFSWSVSYDSTNNGTAGHPGELPRGRPA